MMKIQIAISRATIALVACSQLVTSQVAFADLQNSQTVTFDGRQTEFNLELRGKKEKTRYRTEYYEDTCYRDEAYTDYRNVCEDQYRTECTTNYREECHTEYDRECSTVPVCRDVNRPVCHTETTPVCRDVNRPVCHTENEQQCTTVPICRDVMRPICNSSGCHDVPTRECTNEERCRDIPRQVCENHSTRECTDESHQVCQDYVTRECTNETQCQDVPRQSCSTVPYDDCNQVYTGQECHDEAYTAHRDVPYSCTQSREVADGTDLVEDILVKIKVSFIGDFTAITGQDSFAISVANGVDLASGTPDLKLAMKNDAGTHFYQLKKIQESKRQVSATESEITAHYQLTVTPIESVIQSLSTKPEITTMKLTRGKLDLTLPSRTLHERSKVTLKLRKDKTIGGYETVFNREVALDKIDLREAAAAQTATIPFSKIGLGTLASRPHEATITLTGRPALPKLEGLQNPASTIDRVRERLGQGLGEVTKKIVVRL